VPRKGKGDPPSEKTIAKRREGGMTLLTYYKGKKDRQKMRNVRTLGKGGKVGGDRIRGRKEGWSVK